MAGHTRPRHGAQSMTVKLFQAEYSFDMHFAPLVFQEKKLAINTTSATRLREASLAVFWIAVFALTAPSAIADFTLEPSWSIPGYNSVRDQVLTWLDQSNLEEDQLEQAQSMWPTTIDPRGGDSASLLERAVQTFALADTRIQQLAEACHRQHDNLVLPDVAWLQDDDISPVVRDNLRLYYARWLAHHQLYDEVLATLADLNPQDVLDPSSLLFYRTVAYHQVVQPDFSRATLSQLQERESELPERYRQVADLLKRDLTGLKDESLDHIARRMQDVRRRLDLGRAGKKVQLVEQGVLDSLDRLIKKLEEQSQQSTTSSGGAQSSSPLDESRLQRMRAPMQVDRKDIGSQSGWGDLPAKQREEALQQIGREFPAHYRELIEQYFLDLAEQAESEPTN